MWMSIQSFKYSIVLNFPPFLLSFGFTGCLLMTTERSLWLLERLVRRSSLALFEATGNHHEWLSFTNSCKRDKGGFDMFVLFFSSAKSIYNLGYLCVWTIQLQCYSERPLERTTSLKGRISEAVSCLRETLCYGFWVLPGQLVGVQQMCGRDHDSPHIAVAYSRAYVSALVCQQRQRRASGREKDMLSPSLSSRREGVCPE